jgi:hypothetical protein
MPALVGRRYVTAWARAARDGVPGRRVRRDAGLDARGVIVDDRSVVRIVGDGTQVARLELRPS